MCVLLQDFSPSLVCCPLFFYLKDIALTYILTMSKKEEYFIGVDVGTQSVRAGLITPKGKVVSTSSFPIQTWNPYPNMYEQSSDEIWDLCVEVVKEIIKDIDPSCVSGIGFDATCSLVVLDKDFKSLSVSKTGIPKQNIMLWMDHRAAEEARFINLQKHAVLEYVGGKISPEMEPPKLLWMKKNMPNQWERVGHFFDLPDFLTWKATGSLQRSLCSLVSKWTFVAGQAKNGGWQDDFWTNIGLGDLVLGNYEKIGTSTLSPGESCGSGLSLESANELGLIPGTPVSASIIDAHAGGLGVLACSDREGNLYNLEDRLAMICGTSTCHMKVSKEIIFTPGVWGPYYSAMVPDYWCSEAGQSAAGAVLDHIIDSHPATHAFKEKITIDERDRHITDVLNEVADKLKEKYFLRSVSFLTKDYHVYPDYHGNRSPLANPDLRGMVCGLSLVSGIEDLVLQYVATVQALAYSTKQIINALLEYGHTIECLLVCGGLAKNRLYVQMHADITGLPVIIPDTSEPVLVGCAILAASASKCYPSVISAMNSMCGQGSVVYPQTQDRAFHSRKYEVFQSMLKCQEEARRTMNNLRKISFRM